MALASEPPSILAAARRGREAAVSSRLRCEDPGALFSCFICGQSFFIRSEIKKNGPAVTSELQLF